MFIVYFLFESIAQFHKSDRCTLAMVGGKSSCVFVFLRLIKSDKMHSYEGLCIHINDHKDRECCTNLALKTPFTEIIMF